MAKRKPRAALVSKSRKGKRGSDVAPLAILCRCFSEAEKAITKLAGHWRQLTPGAATDQLAIVASQAVDVIERSVSIAMKQIKGGAGRSILPRRGEPVDLWLLGILTECHEASEVASSCAGSWPDSQGIGSLDNAASALRLACRHLATVQCLLSGEACKRRRQAVSGRGLTHRYRKALDLIRSLPEPTKGLVIANRLGISYGAFKSRYVKVLRLHGLSNEGDGYFIKSR